MKTFNQALEYGYKKIEDGTTVPHILIMHFSKYDQVEITQKIDEPIDFDFKIYEDAINEYLDGKPVQHITGVEWFYGRELNCGNGAFIPRYETEELCDNVIALYDEHFDGKDVVKADVGTGSGAIAVTIDLEIPGTTFATEISDEAVIVAQSNFDKFKSKVKIIKGNMLDPLIEEGVKLDILVSNPPYIPDGQTLDNRVIKNDPDLALWGGPDGLNFYREIFENCNKVLKEKAIMAFEFGWDQKDILEAEVKKHFDNYEFVKDMNDKWRMLFIFIGFKK